MKLMGNDWDKILPPQECWDNCFKVLRPGGFCLAFGHTRLYHRLGCQLEDAGFVVKDCLCWGYASAFPHSYNISLALDRAQGAERDNEPVTDDAKQWDGWGTVLKTAWEPIILAQKPIEGSYIENILKWKVGAMNIDACRVPYASEEDRQSLESFVNFAGVDCGDERYVSFNQGGKKQVNVHPDGRWPANLLWLDPLFAVYDHIFMIPKPSKSEKRGYNEHDTVKPVRLMERLINLVSPRPSLLNEDVVILDPFMGSGTTGVACKRLGRKFIGYDKDKSSFDTARKRLAERAGCFDIFER